MGLLGTRAYSMAAGENPYRGERWTVEEAEDPLYPADLARKRKKPPNPLFLTLKWLVIILVPVYFVLQPNFRRPKPQPLYPCRSNLKNLATALEMYASDNQGHYPDRLELLVSGKYLKTIPTCPAVKRMTYTDYQVSRQPDNFTVSCVGDNHVEGYHKSAPNFPRYNAMEGLVEPL